MKRLTGQMTSCTVNDAYIYRSGFAMLSITLDMMSNLCIHTGCQVSAKTPPGVPATGCSWS